MLEDLLFYDKAGHIMAVNLGKLNYTSRDTISAVFDDLELFIHSIPLTHQRPDALIDITNLHVNPALQDYFGERLNRFIELSDIVVCYGRPVVNHTASLYVPAPYLKFIPNLSTTHNEALSLLNTLVKNRNVLKSFPAISGFSRNISHAGW